MFVLKIASIFDDLKEIRLSCGDRSCAFWARIPNKPSGRLKPQDITKPAAKASVTQSAHRMAHFSNMKLKSLRGGNLADAQKVGERSGFHSLL